jgi:hypothetical protein
MNKTFSGYFIFVAFLFGNFSYAEAASLYIDPPNSTLHRGDSLTLAIRLDTDEEIGECINAVSAELSYPANIEPVDVSIGSSIFNVWIEAPTINKSERTVTFAGGIPNGYCGRVEGDPMLTNTLAEVIFRSPGFIIGGGVEDLSKATVFFTNRTKALLNDGRGTDAALSTYPAKIILTDNPSDTQNNDWQAEVEQDILPPQEFSIRGVSQYPNGDYYVTFSTTDKQTGIDHYEVMEEPLAKFGTFEWGRGDAPWLVVKQPPVHVLKDQSLNSIIRIKAIDKAGNEYIATLVSEESMRTISGGQTMSIVIGFVGLVLLASTLMVGSWFIRRRKVKSVNLENEDDTGEMEPNVEDSRENNKKYED